MGIHTVGVVGCGQMGSGIAVVCALAGYRTIVREARQDLMDAGSARIREALAKGVQRRTIGPAERDAAVGRIEAGVDLGALSASDLAIEAIVEDLAEKQALFRRVDALLPAHAILASNTSSCPIGALAGVTQRPDRVVGIHFFNPVPVMGLVELVRPACASEETWRAAVGFAASLRKRVIAAKDEPGFIVNRLLVPYLLDAIRCVEEGRATREDVDAGMRIGCGHPMGPLELSDFIGLDTILSISDILYAAYRDPRYAAPASLRESVRQGRLGRKRGGGFYP